MIVTLSITIFIESIVVIGYALWRKKHLAHLLLSSVLANLLTQPILWVVLNIFPGHYLITLLIAEMCICGIEGLIVYFYRYNRLKLGEAMFLSLAMNLTSFTVGLLLPI